MSSSDFELRHDVEAELDWDTRLDSRQVGVAVRNGVVTLSGCVDSYAQREAAEEAAQQVLGVRAVANDILVQLPEAQHRADAEIADAAASALQANVMVPNGSLHLAVADGWITLSGEVLLWHQKRAAEAALVKLPGVRGITNNILVSSSASNGDVRSRIEAAFRRRAQLDARNIVVKSEDGTVTLEGEVHSWFERQQAETAAWQAPGVSQVIDHLQVRP